MKNRNPFENKVSLIEMANNILEKKEAVRREKDSAVKIRRSKRIKNKAPKNSIKAVREKNGEIFYVIPSNMKIAGFKNRISKGIETLNEFKLSDKQTITI